MLVSAIEVLRNQLEESKGKNEEFKQQLHAQSELHSGVVENMSSKLKDASVLETRIQELQGQLRDYNKQEPSLIKPLANLEVDHTTSLYNLPPGFEEDLRVKSLIDSLNKVEVEIESEKESKLKLLTELQDAGVERIGITMSQAMDKSRTNTMNIWPTIAECIGIAKHAYLARA